MSTPFRPDRSPVEKPTPGSRTCRAATPGERQTGWPLFGLLFSGHSEKSDSGAAGARKLLPFPNTSARASRASALLRVGVRKVTRAPQACETLLPVARTPVQKHRAPARSYGRGGREKVTRALQAHESHADGAPTRGRTPRASVAPVQHAAAPIAVRRTRHRAMARPCLPAGWGLQAHTVRRGGWHNGGMSLVSASASSVSRASPVRGRRMSRVRGLSSCWPPTDPA